MAPAFLRVGFTDALAQMIYTLYRDKPEITCDNHVKEFGNLFRLNDKDMAKEEFRKLLERICLAGGLAGGLRVAKDCLAFVVRVRSRPQHQPQCLFLAGL